MRGFSRTLFLLLFVVVIAFFLSLRSQKSHTVELIRVPITSFNKISGEVTFNRRGDNSEYIVIKLGNKPSQELVVLVVEKDGIAREIGRISGATFIYTLPRNIKFENLKKVELRSNETGRILAEAYLTNKE
ncbi:hypothetical protein Thein_0838 [Thermodesulfatator indicus DSM 15286]|uniref:Uncharacterized protein n=1 Tax=Thermodesulfatator indicus (strain DSM 15286 / JCM 11887 / CIR29812) TaxID=667014 RepID=F8ACS4_THEID|nr:hypothetical protein [Thermodesulfatator indicus]AEH44715.1 hypothetical protein Thein_0838 [Thermodesulfatator indicus DSM 15286]